MTRVQSSLSSRFFLPVACLFALLTFTMKHFSGLRENEEKARLASAIIRAEWGQPSMGFRESGDSHSPLLVSAGGSHQKSGALQAWLVSEFLRVNDPGALSAELMARNWSHSGRVSKVIRRWQAVLGDWKASRNSWNRYQSSTSVMAYGLFEEGRKRYFEAAGMEQADRADEALVYYLWAIDDLRQVILQRVLPHEAMPEALFVLGSALERIRGVLPDPVQGKRVLALCSELYLGSAWGVRAMGAWQRKVVGEARGGF